MCISVTCNVDGYSTNTLFIDVVFLFSRSVYYLVTDLLRELLALIASFFMHTYRRQKVIAVPIIRSAQLIILCTFYVTANQSVYHYLVLDFPVLEGHCIISRVDCTFIFTFFFNFYFAYYFFLLFYIILLGVPRAVSVALSAHTREDPARFKSCARWKKHG